MEKALVSKLVLNRKDIVRCFRYNSNKCCDDGKTVMIKVGAMEKLWFKS